MEKKKPYKPIFNFYLLLFVLIFYSSFFYHEEKNSLRILKKESHLHECSDQNWQENTKFHKINFNNNKIKQQNKQKHTKNT